ncbi:MAG: cytochrome c biogenesis protein CcsA [Chloroflexi bacterium]|nr:cytochrome c biogenesis protein CcsA [Chloroflexota bacterium]
MSTMDQATPMMTESAAPERAAGTPRLLVVLTIATVLGVIFGLYMGLVYAGTDVMQGEVQRLFYIHMPVYFGAALALGVTVVGGIQYLRTRQVKWDTLALAGVEVGIALAIVNLVTGSIWARPIWNTWWNWDPRLTSAAITILTYAAYLMLRAGIENPDTRRRFAAVYGILAIVTVVITVVIIRIRPDTIHPVVVGPTATGTEAMVQGDFELDATAGVGAALGINMIVWAILVPITLMWYRIRLENVAERVQMMRAKYLES